MTETTTTSFNISQTQQMPTKPSFWSVRTGWLLVMLMALFWSLAQTGVFTDNALINRGGWDQFTVFWRSAFKPVLTPDFLVITLRAGLVTLAYAVAGTFISLLIGSIFGVLASEVWWQSVWPQQAYWQRVPWTMVRGLLALLRGIHELLWGLLLLNIFGLNSLVAILAIAIPYGAIVAKLFSEIIDETPSEPYFVLLNSGASPLKAFIYALIPTALANLLSYSFYRFESAIRAAAVLGVVGAGGLGYQILLSMQTLNYNETWTFFYALMLLSGLADFWSRRVRQRLGHDSNCDGVQVFVKRFAAKSFSIHLDPVLHCSLCLVVFLVPWSFLFLNPDWSLLWSPRSWALWQDMVDKALPLNLNWDYLLELWQLSKETLAISILAGVLAALAGAILSFPAARNFFLPGGLMASRGIGRWGRFGRVFVLKSTRTILLLMRAIPAPIWALVLLFIFFPGILPGAIALGIYNIGVLGRLMAEVTENQDERPSRALKTQGASNVQVFFYGMLPSTTPRYLSFSLYRWEIAIRATLLVGLVGAGGLGRELTQQLAAFNYRAVLVTLIVFIGLTFGVDMLSRTIRNTLKL